MALLAAQPSNIASANNALREYIEAKVETVYENEADFLKYWQRESEEVPTNYRGRRVPIEDNPNPSLASGNPNGGLLATPGAPSRNKLTINYQWLNTGLEQTYEFVLNNKESAVTDLSQRDVDNTIEQLMYWLNIYTSNGDGTTKIATASIAYVGGTPTLFTATGATDSIGTSQVLPNQRILIYDPTGVTQRVGTVGAGSIVVSTVTGTTINTATNLPSDFIIGDIMVPEGTNTVGIKGVPFIVGNSGTYFGINRTTNRRLQSTVVSAGGALTASLLLATALRVQQKTGTSSMSGKGRLEMFYNLSQAYAYANLVGATNTQFIHNGTNRPKYDLGGDNLEFSYFGMPMHSMSRFPGNAIYFLNMKYMRTAVLKKIGAMLDLPAGNWLQAVDASANYLASRQKWFDLALDNYSPAPHRHGALTGLTYAGAPSQASAY